MHPILGHIGRYTVRSYTCLLDLGLLLALGIFYWRAGSRIARRGRWLDGALMALVFGILGGRLTYAAAHADYFQSRTGEILEYWRGGLNWHGALVGAVLGTALYCAVQRLQFLRLADELALVAPLVGLGASLGCLMAGCAYGKELVSPHWLAADLPDIFGIWALRYNVPMLTAGWFLVTGLLLWTLRRRLAPGGTFWLFLFLVGLGLGLLDALRGDAVTHWEGRRLDVVVNWCMAGAGLLGLVVTWRRKR